MEDLKRKKCVKSFKSNTRVFDDDSIEVTPQEKGEPSQKDVKKVGRSKRYATTGKNPLTCIELKCPADVEDKAAFFQKELAKLTKDGLPDLRGKRITGRKERAVQSNKRD